MATTNRPVPERGLARIAYYFRGVFRHGGPGLFRRFAALSVIVPISVTAVVAGLVADPLTGLAGGALTALAIGVLGSYRIWSEEEIRASELQKQTDDAEKRRALKSLLGKLSQKGAGFLTMGEYLDATALNEWEAQVCDLVQRALGAGERSRLDWGGIPAGVRAARVPGMNPGDAATIQTRLLQIGALIPRIDSILLEPGFDPQSWTERTWRDQP